MLGIAIAISCCSKIARIVPINYIVWAVFTLVTTYMVASISSYFDPEVIMIAAALTVTVFLALTVLTFFVTYYWK